MTPSDYNRRTIERKRKAGFIRVSLMVPPDLAEPMKEQAKLAWLKYQLTTKTEPS